MAKTKKTYCAFCGKSEEEVFCLVRGPAGVAICDECVALAAGVVQRQRGRVARGVLTTASESRDG